MTIKEIGICAGIGLACFSAGRFLGPVKTETREIEKIVFKDRIVKDETQQARIEQHEIRRVDGTVQIDTVTTTETKQHDDTETLLTKDRESVKTTVNRPDWSIGLYRGTKAYVGTIDRRILGGLSLGVYGRTEGTFQNNEFGLGLRLEF